MGKRALGQAVLHLYRNDFKSCLCITPLFEYPLKTKRKGGMKLEKSWHAQLKGEIAKPYIGALKAFLAQEAASGQIVYPPEPLVFNAFLQTPFDRVRVVIVGQDPYHGPGQAHGLSFSVPCGIPPPPSLKNIFTEIESDLGIPQPKGGCLTPWARQGVLLLNATLTVRAGKPQSHAKKGWEEFTDAVIQKLWEQGDPLVFLLWGRSAQEKVARVMQGSAREHAVFKAPHPSPLSAFGGFFGCRHFSKTNDCLIKWGKSAINWNIEGC